MVRTHSLVWPPARLHSTVLLAKPMSWWPGLDHQHRENLKAAISAPQPHTASITQQILVRVGSLPAFMILAAPPLPSRRLVRSYTTDRTKPFMRPSAGTESTRRLTE